MYSLYFVILVFGNQSSCVAAVEMHFSVRLNGALFYFI